jgi:hypothetical protein
MVETELTFFEVRAEGVAVGVGHEIRVVRGFSARNIHPKTVKKIERLSKRPTKVVPTTGLEPV